MRPDRWDAFIGAASALLFPLLLALAACDII